ncbi:MAG TPA: hypothetical protein VGD99_20615 [Anaerolineae bacterium]
MNLNELLMSHPHDHIMANTWRLIFERESASTSPSSPTQPIPDFTLLEQVLPEYRLIGLTLAHDRRRLPD